MKKQISKPLGPEEGLDSDGIPVENLKPDTSADPGRTPEEAIKNGFRVDQGKSIHGLRNDNRLADTKLAVQRNLQSKAIINSVEAKLKEFCAWQVRAANEKLGSRFSPSDKAENKKAVEFINFHAGKIVNILRMGISPERYPKILESFEVIRKEAILSPFANSNAKANSRRKDPFFGALDEEGQILKQAWALTNELCGGKIPLPAKSKFKIKPIVKAVGITIGAAITFAGGYVAALFSQLPDDSANKASTPTPSPTLIEEKNQTPQSSIKATHWQHKVTNMPKTPTGRGV